MSIPKSTHMAELDSIVASGNLSHVMMPTVDEPVVESGPVKIKPVETLNEWVAVLQSSNTSTIALTDTDKYKNEGIIVGVGSGILTTAGRIPPQVALGDNVTFRIRDIIEVITSNSGFYAGKNIAIINERNLISKIAPVEFEIIEG